MDCRDEKNERDILLEYNLERFKNVGFLFWRKCRPLTNRTRRLQVALVYHLLLRLLHIQPMGNNINQSDMPKTLWPYTPIPHYTPQCLR